MKVDENPTIAALAQKLQTRLDHLKSTKVPFALAQKDNPVIEKSNISSAHSSDKKSLLDAIRQDVGNCTRCGLHKTRTHIVFGSGNANADLVFVGEAPGEEEDKQGLPFVGRAGQLLTKMITAMELSRDEVYICNVVKSRPPNNRNPSEEEVQACEPFLKAQLAAIQPKVIVGLGKYACQTLLSTQTPITQLRGQWNTYEKIPFMPTYHPAYLLRSPNKKHETWQDLQEVMKRLGLKPKNS